MPQMPQNAQALWPNAERLSNTAGFGQMDIKVLQEPGLIL